MSKGDPMNAKARTARRIRRDRTRTQRAATRARRAIAAGQPQTARTQLVAVGLDDATAKRFASAFSKGVTPTATTKAKVKLRGRVAKIVVVKLYDHDAFAARLAVYRPKSPAAAAAFAALAA
jgi:lipase chaperone LimK